MQSLSQQLSQKTRKFIRAKIRQELFWASQQEHFQGHQIPSRKNYSTHKPPTVLLSGGLWGQAPDLWL